MPHYVTTSESSVNSSLIVILLFMTHSYILLSICLQTQFITLMMYLIYGLANDCKYDKRPVFVMFLYLISHVLLFSNFYRHTYSKPKEITSKQVQSNGTVVDNKKVQ